MNACLNQHDMAFYENLCISQKKIDHVSLPIQFGLNHLNCLLKVWII